jgi:predicted metal-binding membrane protein
VSSEAIIERLLRRDRRVTFAGLAVLCLLAWLYTASGAGLGMTAWEMTRFTLFPHLNAAAAGAPAWTWSTSILMILMWWIMMIAMMTPSAAPTILLYARVHRHAKARSPTNDKLTAIGAFVTGYLLVWLGFAVIATLVHWGLEHSRYVSAMMMGSRSRWLSGAVLLAAGLYQLSAFKNACLTHCRSPASFLSRNWRPHALGSLRLGILHGAYCVGCCWLLMALLYVGGVMNLAWIGALSILVLLEKALPSGQWIRRGAGTALIAWSVATLAV